MGSGLEARQVLEGHHDVYLHVHASLPGQQKHKRRSEIKSKQGRLFPVVLFL